MNPHLFRFTFAALSTLLTAISLQAQPSGGPYGPIQQRYELPKAKQLYYVAPDGADDASGDSLEEPTSIESAIARVVTGDAIVLRGGVYRTGSLKFNQGITMQPYANERPIFKGTEIATDWTKAANAERWTTPWTRLFPAEPADWWRPERHLETTPLHLFNNDMVFADGKLLSAVGSVEDVSETSYFIDYVNGLVTIGLDPAERSIEITTHNSAITRTTRPVHGKTNDKIGPTFRGITFTQYARLALHVEGTEPGEYTTPDNFGKEIVGTTFEHLTITHCSRVAGYFRGDKLTMRHCLVADCGTEGIYVINSEGVLLEKNIVTRTNSSEQLQGYYASSIKIFNQSYNVVCQDNLIIDNPHASGVWYDVGNVDGIFRNNWVENTNNGFFFEISKGAICAGNVFVNCNRGVWVLNSAGVEVYQNTFYNSQASFVRTDRSATAGDHFGWHALAGPDVEERHSHVFKNNLLVADESFEGSMLSFIQRPNLKERLRDPMADEVDGNVYVRRQSGKAEPLVAWSPADTEEGFARLDTLEAFQEEAAGFATNDVSLADYYGPALRGPEVKNFEMVEDFPAINAGTPLPNRIRKVLGWKKSKTSFPGAYPPQ